MTPLLRPLAPSVPGPSREAAADAARRELTKPGYREAQPPLVVRVVRWLVSHLRSLLERASTHVPGGRLGLLLLVAVLVLVAAVVLSKLRPRRAGRPAALFDGERSLRAEDHRALADAAAADGRWADAVREQLRAVVRELEQRGVLDPRPGRTADEVAREAGAVVPDLEADLSRAVRVFDEVWYGGRTAGPAERDVVRDVDRRVRERRLAVA